MSLHLHAPDFLDTATLGTQLAPLLPADPAVWFDAALSHGVRAGLVADGLYINGADASPAAVEFLVAWLGATVGGKTALKAFLRAREIGPILPLHERRQ
ncbi:hypothetical protein [Microvirga massiliensis]|uniref:hypothetical protein n=1 Tax=Microvirga massiliensis TaxID=1033741 RepID=UPI00062B5F34|nr:hypothetical protein [Microvirga massiliensis]